MATIVIVAINVCVFACTSHGFLIICREIVGSYALIWGVSSLYTIVTAMFLHAAIFRLAGNMLFLWVLGP